MIKYLNKKLFDIDEERTITQNKENIKKALKQIEIDYKNNQKEFIDTYYYSGLKAKSILGMEFFNELKKFIDFKNIITEVDSFCDESGYFRLILLGNGFKFILSGCNCGYKGKGSDYTIMVLEECGFKEFCNLKKYVERNHRIHLIKI